MKRIGATGGAAAAVARARKRRPPAYAELQATSNFSFLRGASHPEELVETAAALGYRALAVADRNSLAGVVRAHVAAKEAGMRLVVGARLDFSDGSPSVLCLPTDRAAYGRLSQLLTLGKRRAPKGACEIGWRDLEEHGEGQILVPLPPEEALPDPAFGGFLAKAARHYRGRCFLAASCRFRGADADRLAALATLAEGAGTPLVAVNDVLYHMPDRRRLADILTCIRERCTIDEAGLGLSVNAERHLKAPDEMARLFARYPAALARAVEVAEACTFSLDELAYRYPEEASPCGGTPDARLAALVEAGARRRYPGGVPTAVRAQLNRELALIAELAYAPYFLTVEDIVRFAGERGILCQGRGSAANSAVCYCLGITAVDPDRHDLLFERFVSAARGEPPDIDVDFEHERREEVIQYVYRKYGRDRAGLTATVISYRRRSAVREVGKALGLSADMAGALARNLRHFGREVSDAARVRELGLDPAERRLRLALELSRELVGFPRHLSQHVGGFVIAREALSEIVPIGNAAMKDRTVIEWDKDDIDALGMLKVDLLGLGMLTCVRKAFDLIGRHHGRALTLATVPAEDPAVYDMLCEADAVGVFQVESRAQMSMLPRLRPRCFYDLVIEVAIVRPGPIQGGMVHPYLRRRRGEEPVSYPSAELERVLGKTLGVPLFQEQAMRIAVVAAGFTPAEADRLRRAMAAFRRTGRVHRFRAKLIGGMVARGYEPAFAERCFKQIEGFGDYGFPESHAASFSLLVYVSAWIKRHHPAAFAAALLNSQPMGFYAPAQLVRDARAHGVEVRPPDVNFSVWDCTLEPAADSAGGVALRLGFRQIRGFDEHAAARLAASRGAGYGAVRDVWLRTGLGAAVLARLARADAFGSLGIGRRAALWAVEGLGDAPPPLFRAAEMRPGGGVSDKEPAVCLPVMNLGEEVVEDYDSLKLSLKAHPLALLRGVLHRRGASPAARLAETEDGRRVCVCGLVLVRQRPATAKGVIFATLEDETGIANIVVRARIFERFRRIFLGARLLAVEGRLQRDGLVIHVVAKRMEDLTPLLSRLATANAGGGGGAPALPVVSRDFH